MHIEKVLLRGVGPFDEETIEFPRGTHPRLADVYLLTGPNGTGKSTILYALASLIGADRIFGHRVDLSTDLVTKRMRSRSALVALRTDDGQICAVTLPAYTGSLEHRGSLPDLDRVGACKSRKRWVTWMRTLDVLDEVNDCAYRYLAPLCRAI